MPNIPTQFVTNDETGVGGSSLYYVTANWVIRCSGNSAGGRRPTTFVRQREIGYVLPDRTRSNHPMVGAFPREGAHDGHPIAVILPRISRSNPPAAWRSANGIPWEQAVDEIDAAIEYAQETQNPRASREVGDRRFGRD